MQVEESGSCVDDSATLLSSVKADLDLHSTCDRSTIVYSKVKLLIGLLKLRTADPTTRISRVCDGPAHGSLTCDDNCLKSLNSFLVPFKSCSVIFKLTVRILEF